MQYNRQLRIARGGQYATVHMHSCPLYSHNVLCDFYSVFLFYCYAVSDKVDNKWEITTLCRSHLTGCLQTAAPLRHLIKDYFLCTDGDIMCKQSAAVGERRLEAGAVLPCWDMDEYFVKNTAKNTLMVCWNIFGCSRPFHCLVSSTRSCLLPSGGVSTMALWP